MSATLKGMLFVDEGVRLKPYRDINGYWSIGVGRCLATEGLSDEEKKYLGIPPRNIMDGITNDEAEYLLDNDIQHFIKEAEEDFTWFDDLDNVRKAAIVNVMFNVGVRGFIKFKNTITSLKNKDFDGAADNLLDSDAARKLKSRYDRLAYMLRYGRYEDK